MQVSTSFNTPCLDAVITWALLPILLLSVFFDRKTIPVTGTNATCPATTVPQNLTILFIFRPASSVVGTTKRSRDYRVGSVASTRSILFIMPFCLNKDQFVIFCHVISKVRSDSSLVHVISSIPLQYLRLCVQLAFWEAERFRLLNDTSKCVGTPNK